MNIFFAITYSANVVMTVAGAWIALEYNSVPSYVGGALLVVVGLSKNRG